MLAPRRSSVLSIRPLLSASRCLPLRSAVSPGGVNFRTPQLFAGSTLQTALLYLLFQVKPSSPRKPKRRLSAVDLQAELHKAQIDLVKTGDRADRIGKARSELYKLHIMHHPQMANLLTQEQRGKVEHFMAERRQIMRERFQDMKVKIGPQGRKE